VNARENYDFAKHLELNWTVLHEIYLPEKDKGVIKLPF